MDTEQEYQERLSRARKVDTTSERSGYPRNIKVAYTADTWEELLGLEAAALKAGHQVEAVRLHRRDGWALWHREHIWSIDTTAYTASGDLDFAIRIEHDTNTDAEAFRAVLGEDGQDIQEAKDLYMAAAQVSTLADALAAESDDLEEGEFCMVFLDGADILYAVPSTVNGYSYDTHQFTTAIIITETNETE